MVELINSFPDFNGSFGDKRIEKRAAQALQKLTTGRSSSLRQVTESDAEQKSFYRLFNNESFSEQGIEQSIVKRCFELCKGRHVLCIQDTTEFNLTRQRGRIKAKSGLGKTAKDDILGFMLHSSLVVDANGGSAVAEVPAYATVRAIVDKHCIACHAAHPTHRGVPVAPNGTMFDTDAGLQQHAEKIYTRAVATQSMPLGNETQMTETERAQLGAWIKAGAKVGG